MTKEISKELRCVKLKNGVEVWIEAEKLEELNNVLLSSDRHQFIKFGDEIVNTAEIAGIFSPATMEELTRRKNGEWKCKFNAWHNRSVKCDCHLKGGGLAKFARGF